MSFELDPSKCLDAQQRERNLVFFQSALDHLLTAITTSVSAFPAELKHLFYIVRKQVQAKLARQQQQQQQQQQQSSSVGHENTESSESAAMAENVRTKPAACQRRGQPAFASPDEKLVRIYCVSAFVFLRLLCPAILNPKAFGLKYLENSFVAESTSSKSSSSSSATATAAAATAAFGLTGVPFSYYELAMQFGVFSPAFMFSLSAPNAAVKASSSSSPISSTLSSKNSSSSDLQLHAQSSQQQQHQQQPNTMMSIVEINSSNPHVNCFNVLTLLSNPSSSSSSSSQNANSSTSSPSSSSSATTSTTTTTAAAAATISNHCFYERQIKLLAKVLQTIANMTECKESFMLPLSVFIKSHKPTVVKFIEDISNVSELQAVAAAASTSSTSCCCCCEDTTRMQFEHATCKYLAILHRMLHSFVPHMRDYIDKQEAGDLNNNSSPSDDSNLKRNDAEFKRSLQRLILILDETAQRIR